MKPSFVYAAVVRRVIDGDTVVLDVDLGMRVWRHGESVRLLDVHAAELRGAERAAGLEAKAFLETLLPEGSAVVVATSRDKADKYGRFLGDIHRAEDGAHVNQLLREHAPPAGR